MLLHQLTQKKIRQLASLNIMQTSYCCTVCDYFDAQPVKIQISLLNQLELLGHTYNITSNMPTNGRYMISSTSVFDQEKPDWQQELDELQHSQSVKATQSFFQFTGYLAIIMNLQQPFSLALLINSQPSPDTYSVLRFFSFWVFPLGEPERQIDSQNSTVKIFNSKDVTDVVYTLDYYEKFERVALSPVMLISAYEVLFTFSIFLTIGLLLMLANKYKEQQSDLRIVSKFQNNRFLGNQYMQRAADQVLHTGMTRVICSGTLSLFSIQYQFGTIQNLTLNNSICIISFFISVLFLVFMGLYIYKFLKIGYMFSQVQQISKKEMAELQLLLRTHYKFYLKSNNLSSSWAALYPGLSMLRKIIMCSTLVISYRWPLAAIFIIFLTNQALFVIRVWVFPDLYRTMYILSTIVETGLMMFYVSVGIEFSLMELSKEAIVPDLRALKDWKRQGKVTTIIILVTCIFGLIKVLMFIYFMFRDLYLQYSQPILKPKPTIRAGEGEQVPSLQGPFDSEFQVR